MNMRAARCGISPYRVPGRIALMVSKVSSSRQRLARRLVFLAGFALVLSTLTMALPASGQESPALPDPTADEQAVQQDALVQGAAAKTINAPSGADSVGPDGSFTYGIPLRVPAGVRGVQPSLS